MATIRQAAQDVLSVARDEIAWIAVWKNGRSWQTADFWPDLKREGDPTFDADELARLSEISEADPGAVIVNGYYHNLGSAEDMTRESLADALRWHYERGMFLVSAYIGKGAAI